MESIKCYLEPYGIMPEKAHETDAGFDIFAPHKIGLWSFNNSLINSVVVDTGVHILVPHGYVGIVKTRSGNNFKYSVQVDGTIDSDYTGSIGLKLYQLDGVPHYFEKGDAIAQIVFLPIHPCNKLKRVDSLDEFGQTERGNNGFGSTDRKD